MQKIALPFVACLLLVAATGAYAQSVWKWRDAAGQLHISDTAPPPGTPEKNIVGRPAGGVVQSVVSTTTATTTTSTTPASGASAPDSDLDKKKKAADREKSEQVAAQKAEVDKKNAAVRADNCQRAQTAAAGIQNGGRLAVMNAKGEREFLDDAGRAAELKRTQDIVAANCGPAPAGQ
ncbi:MAG: DUF4124 domain-containing protein [Betaproteobacteria bacterium]